MTKIDPKKAQAVLKKKRVFLFPFFISLLKCSVRTGRMKLKQWGIYSSYNQNGQYYAMPTIPQFDQNGLWHYKGIFFSKHGTLKNTVVHLVNASSYGLTGNQIGEIVKLSPRSFLHHFRDAPGILREKHDGVYVYFSKDDDTYNQQVQNRLQTIDRTVQITDADAVVILVALIKQPDISLDDLAQLPDLKGKAFSPAVIRTFLEHHDLLKKTLDIRR